VDVDEFDCAVFLFLGYGYGGVALEFAEVDSCVVVALLGWLFEVCVGFEVEFLGVFYAFAD